MPEKSVLIFQKDRFYPVSDFEITDLPAIQKKIPYRHGSMGLNRPYVVIGVLAIIRSILGYPYLSICLNIEQTSIS